MIILKKLLTKISEEGELQLKMLAFKKYTEIFLWEIIIFNIFSEKDNG